MSDFIELELDNIYNERVTVNIGQIACIIGRTVQLSTGRTFELTSESLNRLYDRIGE